METHNKIKYKMQKKQTHKHTHTYIQTKKKDGTTTCFTITLASVSKTYNAFDDLCGYCNYPNAEISLFMNAHAVVSKTDSSGNVVQTETAWYHPLFFFFLFIVVFVCCVSHPCMMCVLVSQMLGSLQIF